MQHELKKILVIRFRRVGDSVLSMALCHSLKMSFPHAQIHFVINKSIASLYEDHPDIDRVISFSEKENHGFAYVRKVWRIMKSTHYDVIIDMRSTLKTMLFSLFSLSTPYRIGRKKWYSYGVLTHRIATAAGLDRVESNLNLMKPLAAEGLLIRDEHFPLYISDEEKEAYGDYLKRKGVNLLKPIMLITVATRIVGKEWPSDRMLQILRRILRDYDVQMIFNYSGAAEAKVAWQYYEALGRDSHIFIDIEAKGLRELCALCLFSQFFFGNEGGPRHISQAFSVPSFAIFPPGIDKKFWLPGHNDRYQGISSDEHLLSSKRQKMTYQEQMSLITVEDVWNGLQPMLNKYIKQTSNS